MSTAKSILSERRVRSRRNDRGNFADQARAALETRDFSCDAAALNAAKGAPGSGERMLPPARKPPPKPFVIEHMGHAHYIASPNWPMGRVAEVEQSRS